MDTKILANKINALIVLRDAGAKNQGEIDVFFAAFEQFNSTSLALPTAEQIAHSAAVVKIV